MADIDDVSQFIPEVGSTKAASQISQLVPEVSTDAGLDQVSQLTAEVSAVAGGSDAEVSQLSTELGANSAVDQISQLTIELGRGPANVIVPVEVFVFGLGALQVNWWVIPQLSDSGDELRDKVVKPFWVTGQIHNAKGKVYRYGAQDPINMADLEDGVNFATFTVLNDQDDVTRSKLYPVDVHRALLHTLRLEGTWNGDGDPDRIDEFGYQVARQGIRR